MAFVSNVCMVTVMPGGIRGSVGFDDEVFIMNVAL
jgi:hypothetical protein